MDTIPTDNILLIDGEYHTAKPRHPGRAVSIELSGTFDGASVTAGYVTMDAVPVYVADTSLTAKTAAGRWSTTLSKSGLAAVKVTGATVNTAILVHVVDMRP